MGQVEDFAGGHMEHAYRDGLEMGAHDAAGEGRRHLRRGTAAAVFGAALTLPLAASAADAAVTCACGGAAAPPEASQPDDVEPPAGETAPAPPAHTPTPPPVAGPPTPEPEPALEPAPEPEPEPAPDPVAASPAPPDPKPNEHMGLAPSDEADPKPTEHMAHRPSTPEPEPEPEPAPEPQAAEPEPVAGPPAPERTGPETYGVPSEVYNHLPDEDRQAIRDDYEPESEPDIVDPKPHEHQALRPTDDEPDPEPVAAPPAPERYGVPAHLYNHLPDEDQQQIRTEYETRQAERLRELMPNLPPEDQAAIRAELERLDPPRLDTDTDTNGPTGGPAIGDGPPLEYLPFPEEPGNLSLTVKDKPPVAPPFRVTSQATLTTALGNEHLTADGRRQMLNVEARMQIAGGVTGDRGRAGIGLESYLGESHRYDVTVSPERAQTITEGGEPPNPVDPRSLEPGESVTLREEFFAGTKMEGSYRALMLSDDFREGTRVSAGIKRVDEETVQVIVGDEDFVAQALRLGVGTDDVNVGLTSSRDFAAGDLTTVELDLSEREDWEAYQRFVNEGAVPSGPDVESSDSDRASYVSSAGWDVRVGPISWAGTLHDNASSVEEVDHFDGSTEYRISVRESDVTVESNRTETPSGLQLAENSLLLEGADYSTVNLYQQLQGEEDPVEDGTHDVRIELTDPELEAMREGALDQLIHATERDGNDMTGEEIQAQLRADPYNSVTAMMFTEQMIAAAETPGDVLHALSLEARGNPDALLDFLTRFDINTTYVRHGDEANPVEESELPGQFSFVETD